MTILLFIIIIFIISNNQLVAEGAAYGLMLWYENVLPLLLPFMLISGHFENTILKSYESKKTGNSPAIPAIVVLGIFCGYPIGAKSSAFFVKNNIINHKTGNIILPICNNVSPMFFLGFILKNILDEAISPLKAYVCLFLPYIFVLIVEALILYKNGVFTYYDYPKPTTKVHKERSISEQSITQITLVGLYIMICSIVAEIVLSFDFLSPYLKLILSGLMEITRGITYIGDTSLLDMQIKTALILSLSSFGGISSVMQTSSVIKGSGLSLIHYILVKLLCSIVTFLLCFLII